MEVVGKNQSSPTFSLDKVVSKSFEDQWMEAQKFRIDMSGGKSCSKWLCVSTMSKVYGLPWWLSNTE